MLRFFCSTSQALASIPAGENGFSKNCASKPSAEDDLGHHAFVIAEWNDVADRCLLCRDGIIERELDPNKFA